MRYSIFVDHALNCKNQVECIADGIEGRTEVSRISENKRCKNGCKILAFTDKQLSENDNLERFLDARILKLKEGIK